MAHRREKEMTQNERLQLILAEMLKDDDNKYCADCDAKGPRWASWNLGIFLCIRCAGIHRNLGVHISRVKSVNLDTWTSEQVAMMQEIGNSRGRAIYEANLPENFRRPQTDSALEQLIRGKYEDKRYIAKEWVPPKPKSLTIQEDKRPAQGRRQRMSAKPVVDLTRPPAANSSAVPRPTANGQTRSTAGTAIRRAQDQVQSPQPTPQPSSHTEDLLGLDDPSPKFPNGTVTNGTESDDLFGEFLSSAPPPPTTTAATVNADKMTTAGSGEGGSSLEQDLFGGQQTTVNLQGEQQPQQPQKSTKESILALYGSQPALPSMANTQQPPPAQFLAMPPGADDFEGMLHSSASAPHMSAAFLVGPGGANMPSGMMAPPQAMPANVQGGFMWAQPQQQQHQPQQHSMFGVPASVNGPAAVPQAMFGVQHNPFFAQQQQQQHQQMYLQQIQQQLSGMQLQPSAPAAAPAAGQTLATNLWQ